MSPDVAEKLSLLMIRINAQVDDSIALVQNTAPGDFVGYRDRASRIMVAAIELENRLYIDHPQRKPRQLGGAYEIDPAVFEPRFYDRGKGTGP